MNIYDYACGRYREPDHLRENCTYRKSLNQCPRRTDKHGAGAECPSCVNQRQTRLYSSRRPWRRGAWRHADDGTEVRRVGAVGGSQRAIGRDAHSGVPADSYRPGRVEYRTSRRARRPLASSRDYAGRLRRGCPHYRGDRAVYRSNLLRAYGQYPCFYDFVSHGWSPGSG